MLFALCFRPWTHTCDDSYIYQLSLDLATANELSLDFATAIVSYIFDPARLGSFRRNVFGSDANRNCSGTAAPRMQSMYGLNYQHHRHTARSTSFAVVSQCAHSGLQCFPKTRDSGPPCPQLATKKRRVSVQETCHPHFQRLG